MQLQRLGTGALFALAVAGAFLLGKGSQPEASPREAASPAAARGAGKPAAPAHTDELLGVVLARASASIAPRFEGRLQDVLVRMGDRVEAGSVIAVLDVPTLRHDLRSAEASLATVEVEQALSSVEQSEAEERLSRNQAMFRAGVASGEELATARYQQQLTAARGAQARARLAERKTAVERLRKDNEDSLVRAPFDGIVAARYIDPGAIVGSSTPIVRIISARDFIVRFAVPEAQISRVAVGRRVRVRLGLREAILRGAIDKVAPEIDAASRMMFVEAQLPEGAAVAAAALSGEIARVSIEPESPGSASPAPANPEP
jgi:RND family efflux transporter MFP subunit